MLREVRSQRTRRNVEARLTKQQGPVGMHLFPSASVLSFGPSVCPVVLVAAPLDPSDYASSTAGTNPPPSPLLCPKKGKDEQRRRRRRRRRRSRSRSVAAQPSAFDSTQPPHANPITRSLDAAGLGTMTQCSSETAWACEWAWARAARGARCSRCADVAGLQKRAPPCIERRYPHWTLITVRRVEESGGEKGGS